MSASAALMMVMPTAAAFVMVFMMVTSASASFMVMPVMVMFTAAALMMRVVMTMLGVMVGVPLCGMGMDFHLAFHCAGKGSQLFKQSIGIFGGQAKLTGSEGDGGSFHFGQRIKFCFDFCRAVGAV